MFSLLGVDRFIVTLCSPCSFIRLLRGFPFDITFIVIVVSLLFYNLKRVTKTHVVDLPHTVYSILISFEKLKRLKSNI